MCSSMIKYLLLFAIVFLLSSCSFLNRFENNTFYELDTYSENISLVDNITLEILEDTIYISKNNYNISLTAKITNISDSTITLFGIMNSDAKTRVEGYRSIGFNFGLYNVPENNMQKAYKDFSNRLCYIFGLHSKPKPLIQMDIYGVPNYLIQSQYNDMLNGNTLVSASVKKDNFANRYYTTYTRDRLGKKNDSTKVYIEENGYDNYVEYVESDKEILIDYQEMNLLRDKTKCILEPNTSVEINLGFDVRYYVEFQPATSIPNSYEVYPYYLLSGTYIIEVIYQRICWQQWHNLVQSNPVVLIVR
jgi:hypothetical protein